jgi:hypothetical protein
MIHPKRERAKLRREAINKTRKTKKNVLCRKLAATRLQELVADVRILYSSK